MPTVHGVTTPESVDQPVVHEDLAALARQLLLRDAMPFANTTERTAFFANLGISPSPGMLSYLTDVHRYDTHNGADWAPLLPQIKVKSADQSKTNASMADVTDFTCSLAANTAYLLESRLLYSGADGNNIGEIQFRWTMPAGCRIDWGSHSAAWYIASGVLGDVNFQTYSNDTTSPTSFILMGTSAGIQLAVISGVVTNGPTAGVLQAQFCQNVVSATPSTILAKSWLRLEKV